MANAIRAGQQSLNGQMCGAVHLAEMALIEELLRKRAAALRDYDGYQPRQPMHRALRDAARRIAAK
jgi:hypothetical protein